MEYLEMAEQHLRDANSWKDSTGLHLLVDTDSIRLKHKVESLEGAVVCLVKELRRVQLPPKKES